MARLMYPILLAVAGLVAATSAQQPVERPILSVRTDLVTLSVTVVDTDGALVTDLVPEHFTVLDNGERQPIQLFTSETLPATIGLVVDSSASMRGRQNEVAAVADAFAAMRHPLGEFFALGFNEAVWRASPLPRGFIEDPGQLRGALVTAPAQGMTALYDAIDRGLEHLRHGTHDRRALIAVSDGGDNASRQTLAGVLDRARRAEVPIHTVTLRDVDNRDARPQVLKMLARETGGRVFVADGREDVTRAFARIAREVRSSYTIGFAPPETDQAGFRPVRVLVDAGHHRHLTARTRAGYFARPSRETGK